MPTDYDPKKPKVVSLTPAPVKLEKGVYFWCACGHSKKQPFCDGSHTGYDIRPLRFVVDKPIEGFLCMCKHSQKPPFCDDSHKVLQVAGVKAGDQVPDGVLRAAAIKTDPFAGKKPGSK